MRVNRVGHGRVDDRSKEQQGDEGCRDNPGWVIAVGDRFGGEQPVPRLGSDCPSVAAPLVIDPFALDRDGPGGPAGRRCSQFCSHTYTY